MGIMKHFFLIPALVLSAHAEGDFVIKQALDHSEQKELLRFLAEDIRVFRSVAQLDSLVAQARQARILNDGYSLIEMSIERGQGRPAMTVCLICRLEGKRLRLVDLVRSIESVGSKLCYTLSNRKLVIKDARGEICLSQLLPEPPHDSLLDSQTELRPTERFDSEEDRYECALALMMIMPRWGIFNASDLAEYATKLDFADGRYCLIRADIGSGAYVPLVVILEYIDHPSKEDSYAMRVIGHYSDSMFTNPTWICYYAKNDQTFSIRDGVGRLIYHLDLDTRKLLPLPHTPHSELSE